MVHSMHKMRGKTGIMAIKIDLEKAYDRIIWDFIVKFMEECRFPSPFINNIRACMASVTFRVLWNGDQTTPSPLSV